MALEQLSGTVQNDILKEYMARGTYIYPPAPSLRLITNMFAFCAKRIPKWNPISISGYHIREAGSTAAQEIGFTLADGIAYVEAALKAGLEVDEFAGRLSFFFNVHNNFLEEVAKFRAARRLWARIMKERFKAKDPRSMMLRFHAQTAGSTLTAQQVDNNVVRVALQALAAVMGGAQSLHTNSRDEALALPSEEAARLALRTQQVIAYESGVADIIDPMGGSYAVEALTDELEAKAQDYIRRIDDMGGMVSAIAQWLPAGRDSGSGVPGAAGPGTEAHGGGGSEPVPDKGTATAGPAEGGRDGGAAAVGAAEAAAYGAGQRGGDAVGGRAAQRGEAAGREPHPADSGRGEGVRDTGRDLRRDARRLRGAQGARGAVEGLALEGGWWPLRTALRSLPGVHPWESR